MSYDLAFWVGSQPANDAAAIEQYEARVAYMDSDGPGDLPPPSPAIAAFVADLLAAFPALGEPGDENSPWAIGPEPGDVTGDLAYLNLTFSGAQVAADKVIAIAHRHQLVCFDPQAESLV